MLNYLKRLKSSPNISEVKYLPGKAHMISGMFYRTESGNFYVKSNKRYKVYSERCLQSWATPTVDSKFANISHIPYAGILGFRDGTIIHNLSDGKIYIVSDNQKRQIKTPDAFPEGWIEQYKILVSESEANLHKDGPEING